MHKIGGEKMKMKGRIIFKGFAKGEALVSKEPISFYGGVDPDTGIITDKGHPLEGKSMKGKILIFSRGKGSTVGSYTMYRLKKNGAAPLAIINEECETVVAVGAIISEIPLVDNLDKNPIENIKTGQIVEIKNEEVIVNEK
jgi:predicted aconitase with swiveling domain